MAALGARLRQVPALLLRPWWCAARCGVASGASVQLCSRQLAHLNKVHLFFSQEDIRSTDVPMADVQPGLVAPQLPTLATAASGSTDSLQTRVPNSPPILAMTRHMSALSIQAEPPAAVPVSAVSLVRGHAFVMALRGVQLHHMAATLLRHRTTLLGHPARHRTCWPHRQYQHHAESGERHAVRRVPRPATRLQRSPSNPASPHTRATSASHQ